MHTMSKAFSHEILNNLESYNYLFVPYLMTSVAQILIDLMTRLVNNELEKMWEGVVMV
jgi:hypothetical protein